MVPLCSFSQFRRWHKLRKLLVGASAPNPKNNICDVGYAPCLGTLSKIKTSSFLTFPVGSFTAVYCVAILSKRMFRGLGVDPSKQFLQNTPPGEMAKTSEPVQVYPACQVVIYFISA